MARHTQDDLPWWAHITILLIVIAAIFVWQGITDFSCKSKYGPDARLHGGKSGMNECVVNDEIKPL